MCDSVSVSGTRIHMISADNLKHAEYNWRNDYGDDEYEYPYLFHCLICYFIIWMYQDPRPTDTPRNK